MDFELSEEQRAFQEMARSFAESELAPHAAEWDERCVFPVATLRAAAALGFAGIYVREDAGRHRAVAARCRADLRGARDRLHLDRGLSLDPQHGRLDDRRLRRGRRSARAGCPI